MATFNGLPLYEDKITDEACGMLRISLVDLPAVESDFQKFGKAVRVQMESEEKRLIIGCVMRAGFPIYRIDPVLGEYYTSFSAETIRTMAEKYLEENRQNRVNLMHAGEEVRGVQMVQLFIKDAAKGISPAGFEDIEDGSLFAEFHVVDDEIWGWIKEGILRGFSLEGMFEMQETTTQEDMKKLKEMLAKIISKFTEVTTDKGILTFDGEAEIGKDVYLLLESGEVVDAEDGEYKAEDGKTYVVEGGKIAEIREVTEEKAEDDTQVADDVDIHNLAAEVERLKEELGKKDEAIADLVKRVEALEGKAGETEEALRKMSAAKPAHEEVKSNEAKQSFRNAHQEMLYNLNKAR